MMLSRLPGEDLEKPQDPYSTMFQQPERSADYLAFNNHSAFVTVSAVAVQNIFFTFF